MAHELRHVPISEIKEGERFRQDYGDIQSLIDAIEDKGLLQPITLDTDLNLLAGGRRFRAMRELGMETIPALIRPTDGELDLREVELMENLQRQDLAWQEKVSLTKEIDRLHKEKHGRSWSGRKTAALMNKSVGGVNRQLQLAEAMEAVPELAQCKTEDDAFKMIKKAHEHVHIKHARVAQEKEMSQLPMVQYASDHYRLGDALEEMQKLIDQYAEGGRKSLIKLVEVDPPYAIDLHAVKRGSEADANYKEVDVNAYQRWLSHLTDLLYQVTAPDAFVIFWFGPTWFTETKAALVAAGFEVDDMPGLWNKGQGQTNAPQFYMARAYEMFFLARKGSPKLAKQGRSNVFDFKPMSPSEKWHPTQRPMELIEELITTIAHPGTICMVPFLGSGTTLMAAYRRSMAAFGWDLSPKYRDYFLIKIEEMANQGKFLKEA